MCGKAQRIARPEQQCCPLASSSETQPCCPLVNTDELTRVLIDVVQDILTVCCGTYEQFSLFAP